MKKIATDTDTTELITAEEIALAQVIPIRTETTLTRLPIHRIAKRGAVKIKQSKFNAKGKVITTWEVENPPSSLAYKIDTIIINRRIDEMRTKGEIRQLFKLGSLRDICKELGVSEGKNTAQVKEALYQNAKAFIKAKLDYKGLDGVERTFEFGTTRYTVIFTGEKLPNNQKADGVYIELHPRFHEMLKHSKTRPLDYAYLKELQPSAQRLYELLSFAMFGSLSYGRPNAQMFYSEFCQSAPLTRHHEFFRVRSQMRKIHQPHLESGYLKAVDFEETADAQGQIDWLIRYTPGRKARHEFKEFTTKREKQISQAPPRPQLVAKVVSREEATSNQSSEDLEIITRLIDAGVTESIARTLADSDREECQRQLEALPYRDRIKDKGGYIVKAIRDRYAMPSKMDELKRKEQEAQEQKARLQIIESEQRRQRAEEDYFRFFEPDFRAFQSIELLCIEQEQPEAFNEFKTWFQKNHAKSLKMIQGESRQEELRVRKAAEFFTYIKPELEIRLTGFEQWDSEHNQKACDPLEHNDRIFNELMERAKIAH